MACPSCQSRIWDKKKFEAPGDYFREDLHEAASEPDDTDADCITSLTLPSSLSDELSKMLEEIRS